MWTLVIVLLSAHGASYTPQLEGFDDVAACQETRDWVAEHSYYRGTKDVYTIQTLQCVRTREI